jgi:hypothetical protein
MNSETGISPMSKLAVEPSNFVEVGMDETNHIIKNVPLQ